MLDFETIKYFLIALAIIGVPAMLFYRIGMEIGVSKGIRKQMIRELMASGILEETDMELRGARHN